jgi:hypothetical protein
MIHVSVTGTEQVAKAFGTLGSEVRRRVDAAVLEQSMGLARYIMREELSGQMLKVRTGKRRTEIMVRVRKTDKTTKAEVSPKAGSVLWMLAKGMAPRRISVMRQASAVERRAARAFGGRGYRKRLRRMVGSYLRTHHLQAVPFMQAAIAGHRSEIRGAIEDAVNGAVKSEAGEFSGAGVA